MNDAIVKFQAVHPAASSCKERDPVLFLRKRVPCACQGRESAAKRFILDKLSSGRAKRIQDRFPLLSLVDDLSHGFAAFNRNRVGLCRQPIGNRLSGYLDWHLSNPFVRTVL